MSGWTCAITVLIACAGASYCSRDSGRPGGVPGAHWLMSAFYIVPWFALTPAVLAAFVGAAMQRKIGLGNAVGPFLIGTVPAKMASIGNPGPEWWQRGALLDSAPLSIVALGLLRGLYLVPAAIMDVRFIGLVIALPIATVLALYLARREIHTGFTADGAWKFSEYLTPPLAILLAVAISLTITR